MTGPEVTLLNASSARAEAVSPLATAAPPTETVALPNERFVTLYVAAATDVLEEKFTPVATSEQSAEIV